MVFFIRIETTQFLNFSAITYSLVGMWPDFRAGPLNCGDSSRGLSLVTNRWAVLAVLSFAEMLAMSLWFVAAAIVPQLTLDWSLTPAQASWLTLNVQLGFVVGTLISAGLNLPDRWPTERMIAACCLLAAVMTWSLIAFEGFNAGVMLTRFLTGAFLAGVYPPGMKLVASWFVRGRGMGVGVLVGVGV